MKNAKAVFKRVKPTGKGKGRRCAPRWLSATGTAKWRFRLRAELPTGRYVVYARAVDAGGVAESSFSRRDGNRYQFRVTGGRLKRG